MKKKIFRSIVVIAMAVLILSLTLAVGFLYNYFNQSETQQLKNELHWASVAMNENDDNYIQTLNNATYRFTLINPDGTVLYDTKVNSAEMENHLGREEIEEALTSGEGNSVRYSSTLTEQTQYASIKLNNGMVLRASISQKSIMALLILMLPYILVIILLAAVIAFFLAKCLAKNITEPLNELDLENPTENNTYDELSPILTKLNKQHKQIKSQMEVLKQKQNEFDQIVSSMNEGLILLDEHGNVLSMNKTAKKVFAVKDNVIGNSFLTIDRTLEVSHAVNDALAGQRLEFCINRNGSEYQLNISPIKSETKKLGVVILAFDITDKAFAERNRQEFTTNVTHELKTPLQSIIGSAELLESGLVKPEDTRKFIGNIHEEATRLVTLINDIICLSQLDERVDHITETVNIMEVVNEVVKVLSTFAAKRNVSFEVIGEDLNIKGVHRYIYEIIYNLCDNAVRYNKEGGKVIINIYREKNHTVIAVSDTGIGVAVEHQSRIFERFYRVDKSHSKETGGTGLGLSIVKHAVQFHGGKIEIESELKKGTTIKVVI